MNIIAVSKGASARSTPLKLGGSLRIEAPLVNGVKETDSEALKLVLTKRVSKRPPTTQEARVTASQIEQPADDKRPENGAVQLLKRARKLVGKLKNLENQREDNKLSTDQLEKLTEERKSLSSELNDLRESASFKALVTGVALADTSITFGRSSDAANKLKASTGLFGNAFIRDVERGNSQGVKSTLTTLSSVQALDPLAENSSASLSSLEQSLDDAISFFTGDGTTPPDPTWDPSQSLSLTMTGLEGGLEAPDPAAALRDLIKTLKDNPEQSLQAFGDIDRENATNLLYGDSVDGSTRLGQPIQSYKPIFGQVGSDITPSQS